MDWSQPHGSSDDAITRQCSATSKRSGHRCRKHAMRGRTVCRVHGGATPRGVASPHWKHGKYSTILPDRLAAKYEDALRDRRLMSLRDAIALVDVEIGDTLQSLSDGKGDPASEQQVWLHARQALELRRKLVETEVKHLLMSGQMVTAEQVVALMAMLLASVDKHVNDPVVMSAVSRTMQHALREEQSLRGAWETFNLPETRNLDDLS